MKVTTLPGQRIAADYPDAFTNKHVAILGTTGAGKTTVAKVAIVEPLLDRGQRVHIIDPKTDWWGLRLDKTGKKPGYKIYIFGGERGDYPLRAADTKALTEALATSSDSAVLDTSKMTVEERMQFFTAYAETILAKNKGPLNIVVDEAHLFMPQAGAKIGGLAPRMLHAGNNMVSLGRSKGLRVAMLTQRPQKLHKDSLTLAQALIALRVFHPLDRKAIVEWMDEQAGGAASNATLLESLSGLKPGEGWAWSPTDSFLERAQFPLPRTFDSSKAPEMGDDDVPALAPLDMDALTGKLAKLAEEKAANDPAKLKARIKELEKNSTQEIGQARADGEIGVIEARQGGYQAGAADGLARGYEIGKKAGFDEGFEAGYRRGGEDALGQCQDEVQQLVETLSNIASPLTHEIAKAKTKHLTAIGGLKYDPPTESLRGSPLRPGANPNQVANAVRSPAETARMPVSKPPSTVSDGGTLPKPQQRVADALELWHSLGHDSPTREQVAALAGYSPRAGGFNNIVSKMKIAGLIEADSGRLALRAQYGSSMSREEAAQKMLDHLSAPQRKIIDTFGGKDGAMIRDQVASLAGYTPGAGGFNNLVSSLSVLGIIEKPNPGWLVLAPWAAELLA